MAASRRATIRIKPQWKKRTRTRATGPSDELEGKWVSFSSFLSWLCKWSLKRRRKVIVDGWELFARAYWHVSHNALFIVRFHIWVDKIKLFQIIMVYIYKVFYTCIMVTSSLWDISIMNIFSHFVTWIFLTIFWWEVNFDEAKLINFFLV